MKKLFIFMFCVIVLLQSCSQENTNSRTEENINKEISQIFNQLETIQDKYEKHEKSLTLIEDKMVKQSDIDKIKIDLNDAKEMLKNLGNVYVTKSEALKVARKKNSSRIESTSTSFNDSYDYDKNNQSNLIRPVWIIEFVHPAGNKSIYYIDALTTEVVNIKEIESSH